MADNKEISQLITAEQTTANDLMEVAIPAPSGVQSDTGYVSRKITFNTFATWLANHFTFLTQLKTYVKTIIGGINEVHDSLAEEYDDTSTYNIGDVRRYHGVIYKANTNISAAEAFNPAHWDATVICAELGGSAIALAGLIDTTILNPHDGDVLVYNATSQMWVAGSSGGINYVDIPSTLIAGATTVVFTNAAITTSSKIEPFVDTQYYGVNPSGITVTTGQAVLTYPAQNQNVPVMIRVW